MEGSIEGQASNAQQAEQVGPQGKAEISKDARSGVRQPNEFWPRGLSDEEATLGRSHRLQVAVPGEVARFWVVSETNTPLSCRSKVVICAADRARRVW